MWMCVWCDVPSWWGTGSCRPSGTSRRERRPALWQSELCYICGNLQKTHRGRRDVGAGNKLLMRENNPSLWFDIKAGVVAVSSSSSYFCCEEPEQDGGRHFTSPSRRQSGSLLLTLYYKYNYILKITIMSLRDPSVCVECRLKIVSQSSVYFYF